MTNIAINDDLLKQVIECSGLQDTKLAIDTALKEYIKTRQKQQLISMFGTVEYYDDYDYKETRQKETGI